MQSNYIVEFDVRVDYDAAEIETLISEWSKSNIPPAKVFLSIAESVDSDFLGWVGEFASDNDITEPPKYFGKLFKFCINGVEFFGRAHDPLRAQDTLNNGRLRYLGGGALQIVNQTCDSSSVPRPL